MLPARDAARNKVNTFGALSTEAAQHVVDISIVPGFVMRQMRHRPALSDPRHQRLGTQLTAIGQTSGRGGAKAEEDAP